MAFTLTDGVRFHIGTALGTAVNITAISNADPAVATAPAHGLANGTPGVIRSGWEEINDSVGRVIDQTSGSFKLEGLDTTDNVLFPSGSGAGTFTPVTAWTEVPQVTEASPSGGEMQYTDVSLLALRYDIKIPTRVSGATLDLTLATDPSLPTWKALAKIGRGNKTVPIRTTTADGSVSYGFGYFFMSPMSQMAKGSILTTKSSIAVLRPFVNFAS